MARKPINTDVMAPQPEHAGSPPSMLRRRGLVAGAAALAAELMAKGIADAPDVSAANGNAIIIGSLNHATRTTTLTADPGFDTGGASSVIDADGTTGDANAPINGITASGSGNRHGVVGQGGSNGGTGLLGYGGGTGPGVSGSSSTTGVQGLGGGDASTNATGFPIGVRGVIPNSGYGVRGEAGIGYGVYGTAPSGVGVGGASTNNTGVLGQGRITGVSGNGGGDSSTNTTGFPIGVRGAVTNMGYGVRGDAGNGSGVYGTCTGGYGVGGLATGVGYGVVGSAASGIGVIGGSTTGYGVVGSVGATGAAALYGSSTAANTPAFAAYNSAAGGLAGSFNGNVYINGDYTATGAKSAAVPHPDGSHRLVYCMESPESWFEDFGEGTITGGKAEVKLDPDFAAIVNTNGYHVFFTEHEQHNALHVAQRAAGGFTVQADAATLAAKGKRAADVGGTFSWRVVAKRKDVQAPRLAKFTLPKVPPPPALMVIEPAKKA